MSELLLEKLSKKTTKNKMKPVRINLDKGQVAVQVNIVRSADDYDITSFRQKLLKRGLRAPKIPERKNSNKNLLEPIKPSTILPKLAINIKLKVM